MWSKLRARLIDDARQWHKMWSVRLAAFAAALGAAIVAAPQMMLGLLAYVPEDWRPAAAAVTAVVSFVIPTLLRLWKQPGKDC